MIEKLKKFNTVSFTLEGVLSDELNGTVNPLKEEMQSICRELIKMGKQVIILSKRYEKNENKHLSIENKKEHKSAYDLAQTLGVYDIVFTNRNPFYHYINNDHSQCHINCSGYETLLINRYKPYTTTFNINQEIWLQPS